MKFFTLFSQDEIHLAPETKVVPAEAFSKLLDAQELVDAATQSAADYKAKVEQECIQLKQEADAKGFEEGLARFNEQLALIESDRKKLRADMEKMLVPLAIAAVKKILGRELEIHPEAFTDLIATALKGISQHQRIKIFVNKVDLEALEAKRPELRALFTHLETLSISARDDIAEKSCTVETEAGILQLSLENQLKALEKAFHEALHKESP